MFLHDSLSNKTRSIEPSNVSIYACGITPYSDAHVGHARTYVVFDFLAKTLRALNHDVRLVRNITDIDDKIIAVAKRDNVHWSVVADKYAAKNRQLMLASGLDIPEEPKASAHVPQIIDVVQRLIGLGLAYVASTGDVLYRVDAYKGALLIEHQAGALLSQQGKSRVSAEGKEDVRDFALWKTASTEEPGFLSPWGWGRPGWHIECTAMIGTLFNGHVTIHGGGTDLKFPHHQSEIMQSEPVFGVPVADVWMHNGSVLFKGVKMSKSLGNVVGWSQALSMANEKAPGLGADVLRYALLKTHWRQPFDWSDSVLDQAVQELVVLSQRALASDGRNAVTFAQTLARNFNTPHSLGWLHTAGKNGQGATVIEGLALLGISPHAWAAYSEKRGNASTLSSEEVVRLQNERESARKQKNWARADEIRDYLQSSGALVQDAKLASL